MTEVFWQRKVRQNCYKPLRSPKKPPTIKQKSNLVSRVWQSSQNFISCLRSVCYILLWLFIERANKKEHVYNTPLDIIYIVRHFQAGQHTARFHNLLSTILFQAPDLLYFSLPLPNLGHNFICATKSPAIALTRIALVKGKQKPNPLCERIRFKLYL